MPRAALFDDNPFFADFPVIDGSDDDWAGSQDEVEDVLDVDVDQEAETDEEAEGRGEVARVQLQGNVRRLSSYSRRVHPSFPQPVSHLLSNNGSHFNESR